jgi:cystathionine gamma-synthase
VRFLARGLAARRPRRSRRSSTPSGKPRRTTPTRRRRLLLLPSSGEGGSGFGGLFSLTFAGQRTAEAFYDALACATGPSLGTNFTLACPYTILAHYAELDWAAQYGVPASAGSTRCSLTL